MGRYIRGNVDEGMSLGTLAAATGIIVPFDETVNERTLVSSIEAAYALSDVTPGAGIGPVIVGVAHSDYTLAEIEEWIENTGSWNEGDMISSREIGRRLIRRVGTFDEPGSATATVTLNDGKPVKTKLNWVLLQGQGLSLWAYNKGSAAFATTSPSVFCDGHVNLWPR